MSTPEFSPLCPDIRPVKYSLTLTPDLERFTFSGEEIVDIEILEPCKSVLMNAIEINVQSASIVFGDDDILVASRIDYDESSEVVKFSFNRLLPLGFAKLFLQFTGEINDRLHGLYRSTYVTPEGEKRILAATQFESTDARRAFPCWDEPARKATFETALIIPSYLKAVSNTPIANEESIGRGMKRVGFEETPAMSTYLLAFVIGELECVEETTSDGVVVRVWTTPGKVEQGRFALDVAVRLLPYFNTYFGIPYPLPKLDHLAIPDFAAGAMENWGAITYRETALLFDPENSGPGTRQRIAEVVAHEMAHMWFGDLVTMAWWNDLWLNESFASWMATKAVDSLFPEWDMWTQFIVDDQNAGMSLDGLENSHPIEQEVRNPAEVSQLFDAISYSKGASIIRMLEQFLGHEQFRRGLHKYISAHAYGNARTQDLWQAMEDESGQPVTSMMNSWVQQTGYPVLEVEINRGSQVVEAHISQRRFLYSGEARVSGEWHVPIKLGSKLGSHVDAILFRGKKGILHIDRALLENPATDWIKFNSGQTGFYRVQYAAGESDKFIRAIERQELQSADRLGLQSDAYALVRAGALPVSQFLKLAGAYKNEEEYGVWADLVINLRQIDYLISHEPCHDQFRAFGRDLLQTIVRKMGWDAKPNEGHLQALLRSMVLSQIGAFGDDETLREARVRFELSLKKPLSLLPELRGVVYSLAAQEGDQIIHDSLRGMANQATLQEEKVRLHLAMTRFKDPLLLRQTLEMSLSEEVRPQDTVMVVGSVSANAFNGVDVAWDYIKENWTEFYRRYGSGGFAMMRLVGVTGNFSTREARREVENFFEGHHVPSATRTIEQSLEKIDLNVTWLERNRSDLMAWFGH